MNAMNDDNAMNHDNAMNDETTRNGDNVTLSLGPGSGHRPVTMRGPADMAELLPYLLGFFPDDSIVAVGLHGPDLHQGGVLRADIPASRAQWPAAAEETAALLVDVSEQRGSRPIQVLLYLCQDPVPGHGPPVDGLRSLADGLRAAFARRGVPVKESLCVSDGRWWSFLCRREGCCDPAGNPIRRAPAPGPAAAAATFAGLAPRGSRKAIVAGLAPIGPPAADTQRAALARAGTADPSAPGIALLDQAFAEFAAGARELDEDRTARLLLALRDRRTRDRGAEYVRPAELAPAERLWRFLARRAVPPHENCAVAPLTLLAWASWVAGDTATARVVLGRALDLDPSYLLADLLHESLNDGMTPEALLAAVEGQRLRREAKRAKEAGEAGEAAAEPTDEECGGPAAGPGGGPDGTPDGPPGGSRDGAPGRGKARRRRRGGRRAASAVGPGPAGGAPGGPAQAAPEADGSGPTALVTEPGRRRVERSDGSLRLGRGRACTGRVVPLGSGAHRCTGRSSRGARHAR
ncbi:DUF4192 domain-containing protein [Streptomyces sp. SP17BM10]|uniref:DUF4192 domain-containing protein n=1 Tax=Streptomyces sp. SP17BM10 TaxID=3002530 RepID=UPI002E775D15|nr:DUF4192 domain-containing protein [Streptomyces sp. SP17BM10]MEE1781833.1 DUF4192 domain-containing protein [Streptomyces sp. SP17BM10]